MNTQKTKGSWLLVAFILLAASCGPRVDRIPLNDPRLPVEARRWLADAEDEVAIAQVGLDEAEEELAEARNFRRYVEALRWPSAGPASTARQRLDRMVEERLNLARLVVDMSNQRIALAQAMLVRARAETAVRHDIAAYNLDPITEAAGDARDRLDELAQEVERQRATLDQATTQFWESYAAYLQGGGNSNVLWVWEGERPAR